MAVSAQVNPPPPVVTLISALALCVTPHVVAVTEKLEIPAEALAEGLSVAVEAAEPPDQEGLVGLREPETFEGGEIERDIDPEQPLRAARETE